LNDGQKRLTFGLHFNTQPGADAHAMCFFDPEQELAKELEYIGAGLLKVSRDKLTLCLVLDVKKAKGQLPDDFTAPAGSGRLVLEFQREKPLAGKPVAPADPLRLMLEKRGYIAVPLVQDDGGGGFTVACKVGSEAVRLVLDTGAESMALDVAIAKKLGLTPRNERVVAEGVVGSEVSLRGLSIGSLDGRTTMSSLPVAAYDFSAANVALASRKLPTMHGLLGHSTLDFYSAVIDYSTRTLYLLKPLDGLWPKVEGKWIATRVQDDGAERKIDPKTPPRLQFKDRLFGLTYGGRSYRFGLHVIPDGKGRYTIALFNSWEELDGELSYLAGGVLKVDGDKLTLCVLLHPSATKDKTPTEFQSKEGSGYILFEFKREK
jgi:hypothetical protein